MGKSRASTLAARTIRAACCGALLALPATAWAGNQVVVTATITTSCTAFAVPLEFGTLPAKAFNLTSTTTLQVDCPALTTFSIAIDNGLNFGSNSRRMVRQGGQAKWLRYELYKDAALTQRWGSTGGEVVVGTVPASGARMYYTIYGNTSGNVGSGGYMDTVTVTVTY